MPPVKKSNANRFINAYNIVDYTLRTLYNFKTNMSFSDLIRRCSALNGLVRKYEDDLLDYARLRNAIVHRSNDMIIAEPHLEVVDKFENIAKLISTPPLVINTVCRKNVVCVDYSLSIKEVIKAISSLGYSNLPVYKNGAFAGLANGQKLLNRLGKVLGEGSTAAVEWMKRTKIEDICADSEGQYILANSKITVDEALSHFNNNRKLLCVLITNNGSRAETPIGIVTAKDTVALHRILENY